MIDDRTGHLNLPLPHPDNLLKNDVNRIREAVTGLDSAIQNQDSSVSAAITQAKSDVDMAMGDSVDLITDALDEQRKDVNGQLRRLRLNQLLGLDI
jgi:hypothetical protein